MYCVYKKIEKYNEIFFKLNNRCKTQNEQLLQELKKRDREIPDLRKRLHDIETQLTATNSDKAGMKISYEETIANLTNKLENLRKAHDQYEVINESILIFTNHFKIIS